jgi:hypothetical protein
VEPTRSFEYVDTSLEVIFQKRLPTKEKLTSRGLSLNSSILCVGGCGSSETEDRLFFNCPTFGSIWREIVKWL